MNRRAIIALGLLLAACPSAQDAEPSLESLETKDVTAAADANLSTEEDTVGQQRVEKAAGVLPGDFPADIPLLEPYSVIDFGETSGGRKYVQLAIPVHAETVRERYLNKVQAAGWAIANLDPWIATATKEGRSVVLVLAGAKTGSELRIEY